MPFGVTSLASSPVLSYGHFFQPSRAINWLHQPLNSSLLGEMKFWQWIIWTIALCPWVVVGEVNQVLGRWFAWLLSAPYIIYDIDSSYQLVLWHGVHRYHGPQQTRGRRNGFCRNRVYKLAICWTKTMSIFLWLIGQAAGSSVFSPQPHPVSSYCHRPLSLLLELRGTSR